jgi:molybdopterin-containing oxidoreductase family iron-sulfur binding subunit
MEKYLNPNVSARMRGIVEKCSFCFHRYQKAMEKAHAEGRRELEEIEYQTACTQACPAGAIIFGDLNNPEHQVHQIAKPNLKKGGRPQNPHAFRLLEELETNTKVYYLSSKQWVQDAIHKPHLLDQKEAHH